MFLLKSSFLFFYCFLLAQFNQRPEQKHNNNAIGARSAKIMKTLFEFVKSKHFVAWFYLHFSISLPSLFLVTFLFSFL